MILVTSAIVFFFIISILASIYCFVGLFTVERKLNPKMLELWDTLLFPIYLTFMIVCVLSVLVGLVFLDG